MMKIEPHPYAKDTWIATSRVHKGWAATMIPTPGSRRGQYLFVWSEGTRCGGSGYVPTLFDGFVKLQEVHDNAEL